MTAGCIQFCCCLIAGSPAGSTALDNPDTVTSVSGFVPLYPHVPRHGLWTRDKNKMCLIVCYMTGGGEGALYRRIK